MDAKCVTAVLVVVFGVHAGTAGELCWTGGRYNWLETTYCSNGCCGSLATHDQFCCFNIGVISGGTIGGLILLCIIIGVVWVCCKKNRPGRVIQPAATTAVIMTHQQGYGHMQQQYPPVQPAGQAGNPAYPPPYSAT